MDRDKEHFVPLFSQRTLPQERPIPKRSPFIGFPQQTQLEVDPAITDLARRITAIEASLKQLDSFLSINTVYVNTLRDDFIEIKQPIAVNIEQRQNDEFIACLYDIDLYGYGESPPDALDDLVVVIVNQYCYLKEMEGNIEFGELPLKQWKYFKSIIEEKDVH